MPWPSKSRSIVTRERPSPAGSTVTVPTTRIGPFVPRNDDAAWRIVSGDLVGDRALAAGHLADLGRPGCRRAPGLGVDLGELTISSCHSPWRSSWSR